MNSGGNSSKNRSGQFVVNDHHHHHHHRHCQHVNNAKFVNNSSSSKRMRHHHHHHRKLVKESAILHINANRKAMSIRQNKPLCNYLRSQNHIYARNNEYKRYEFVNTTDMDSMISSVSFNDYQFALDCMNSTSTSGADAGSCGISGAGFGANHDVDSIINSGSSSPTTLSAKPQQQQQQLASKVAINRTANMLEHDNYKNCIIRNSPNVSAVKAFLNKNSKSFGGRFMNDLNKTKIF